MRLTFTFILVLLQISLLYAQNILNVKHYTTDQGLPHNITYCVFQDKQGYLWIGTDDGLVKFDGKQFKTYRSSDGLLSNYVIDLAEAEDGTLWIGTWKGGVNYMKNDSIYNPQLENPLLRVGDLTIKGNTLVTSDKKYITYTYTKTGNQWKYSHHKKDIRLYLGQDTTLIYDIRRRFSEIKHKRYITNTRTYVNNQGQVLYFNAFSGIWAYQNDTTFTPFLPKITQQDTVYHLSQDSQGKYWMGMKGRIILFDENSKTSTFRPGIPHEKIYSIEVTSTGKIYFLTNENELKSRRLYSYDPATGALVDLMKKLNFKTLPAAIKVDQEDNLWIATNGEGVYCISPSTFRNYDQAQGLANLFVKNIAEDQARNVYVGTDNGLFLYQNGRFYFQDLFTDHTSYKVHAQQINRAGNLLVNIQLEAKAYNGNNVIQISPKGKTKVLYQDTLSSHMYSDSQDLIWFFGDRGVSVVQSPRWASYEFVYPKMVQQIFEYANKYWLATNQGLFAFEPHLTWQQNQKFWPFIDTLTVADGLPSNLINTVIKAPHEALWIGTKEGLSFYKAGQFINYDTQDGLPSNNCTQLLEDDQGVLWIGTPKGLSSFDGQQFRNYNHHNGLIASDINCLFLDHQQQLWIGTSQGISVLDVHQRPLKVTPPRVYFTNFELGGTSFSPFSQLTIPYQENLRIYFSAPTYIYPEGVQFQYRLNGTQWLETKQAFIEYNQPPPGTNTLEVRAKKFNSDWSTPQKLTFAVAYPWWMRWWAVLLYILGLASIFYGALRWRSRKLEIEKHKLEDLVSERTQELVLQKEEIASQAEKLLEMDRLKSHFFANISHEFRTPLALILGPAEKLKENTQEPSKQRYFHSIISNVQRLLRLVNQLLDFSKLEQGKVTLQLQKGNLNLFLQQVIYSFEPLAQQKGIALKLALPTQDVISTYDQDKLEKVCFNLLSNALKFTLEQGTITTTLTLLEGNQVEIKIEDTGVGIPENALPHIFDRFYQVDGSSTRAYEGTGIGLSLVKELVELHQGKVSVQSIPDKGTIFSVILPHMLPSEPFPLQVEPAPITSATPAIVSAVTHSSQSNKAANTPPSNTILVVEDNEELRKFLCMELANTYQILEATNGAEGTEQALQYIPDLIVSDVMMPHIDGLAMLQNLKNNSLTSHIPVILLTAKASFESKISGLELGSDDYLTKPFSPKELLLRVKNRLLQRDKLREMIKQKLANPQMASEPLAIVINSMDEVFLQKALATVETHMDNSEFDVTIFCQEMGLSRSSLHKKLKALANLSTTAFIRQIRLKRAASLLRQKSGLIDEIALQVGFNDTSYFSRCFKKQFGVSPKEYH